MSDCGELKDETDWLRLMDLVAANALALRQFCDDRHSLASSAAARCKDLEVVMPLAVEFASQQFYKSV